MKLIAQLKLTDKTLSSASLSDPNFRDVFIRTEANIDIHKSFV